MPQHAQRRGRWFLVFALGAVLPFTLVACGDDDDDSATERLEDAATSVGDAVSSGAENAQSAVAGITPLTVDLKEVADSGVTGNVVVTPEGSDRSRATFHLDVDGSHGQLTAGIWESTCDGVAGEPAEDLGQVDDGTGTEAFSKSISDLKDSDHAFAVRDGAAVVACGGVG